ncbi:hypothetical protein HMPREF9104_03189 [Lentilactobacillus kisonensis F0435]|uniref:Uncharacterized protein n=1 Tax=Lentilactobacillus kisonensis F0435 TaxID=797516 RepID=H1LKN5_9LACO|nr:hypothetical protein HMPREF9104_03189 [Lentilactobacillus kisonensis F0435]
MQASAWCSTFPQCCQAAMVQNSEIPSLGIFVSDAYMQFCFAKLPYKVLL